MARKALIHYIHKTMFEHGYSTNLVASELDGKLKYLSEVEVRALQIMFKEAAEKSDDDFEALNKRVTIYSGRCKGTSHHKMIIRKDGRFANEFEPGFFDINTKLSFELF